MIATKEMQARQARCNSVRPKKEYGQNFLNSSAALEREAMHACITKKDTVLEIGPGTGMLTVVLAKKAKKVTAIEIDTQFRKCLDSIKISHNNIEIIWGDARSASLPAFDKVVSNLPFKVAVPLIFRIMENDFKCGVFIVQKKLAERVSAKPGSPRYSRVSVQLQRLGKFRYLDDISKELFSPKPDVECASVLVEKTKRSFNIPSDDYFKKMLEFFFMKRKSRIKDAVLALRCINSRKAIVPALEGMKSLAQKKVENLLPEEFGRISWELHKKKIKIPQISNEEKRTSQKKMA